VSLAASVVIPNQDLASISIFFYSLDMSKLISNIFPVSMSSIAMKASFLAEVEMSGYSDICYNIKITDATGF